MVDVSDIRDEESLKAWLEDQPRAVSVWIASRVAARMLLVWWGEVLTEEWAREANFTALPVLRGVLISSVAAAVPFDDIHAAATAATATAVAKAAATTAGAATTTAGAATAANDPFAHITAFAAFAAADAGALAATFAAAAATAAATAAAAAHAAASWEAVRADAERVADGTFPDARPLWPDGPGPLAETWRAIKSQVKNSEDAEDWQFWIDWYDSLLDGRPMLGDAGRTREMLEKIARIEPATWDEGPEAVNPVIRGIWEGYLVDDVIARNPLALSITRNEKTGKLECEPKEARDLEEIVRGIRRALREFTARCRKVKDNTDLGNAILSAFATPIADLRRDVGKYRLNPRQLFRVLEETRREMRLIARDEGFANDSSVDCLLGNLEQQGEDICVSAPEVLEEVRARLSVRVQLFNAEQSIAAMSMTSGMIIDSDGLLRSAAAQALLVIMDDARSEADKQAAWTFILGALPRGARALRMDGEDGSKPSDDPSLLDTITGYADSASKIDRGVDALQEAMAEGGPWVAKVFSEIVSGNFWGLRSGGLPPG